MSSGFRSLGVALVSLALAGSGCVGDPGGLFAGPTAIPMDAPSEVGDGSFPVQVKVVKESGAGEAIVGAPVVIFEIPKPHAPPSIQELMSKNATLGGRTGADGILWAHLELGKTYSFITANPDFTTEARHLVKINPDLRDKPLVITVFKSVGSLEYKGKVPSVVRPDTPFLNLGTMNAKWWPIEVRFHEDNASTRQYLYRLRTFDATFTATPPPGSHANLQLRAALFSDGKQPVVFDVRGSVIGPTTTITKRLTLAPWQLAHIATMKNPVMKIGPMTFESAVAPQCVPWDLTIETSFDNGPRPVPGYVYYYGYGPDPGIPEVPSNC